MDRDVVQAVVSKWWRNAAVTGVTEDSRAVRPGMVFVARRGRQRDGHHFLPAAIAAGAILTVGEYRLSPEVPDILVPDAGQALAQLVSAWYGDPGQHLTLVGVTGTNGKTTTNQLTAAILAAGGAAVGSIGTLGYCFAGQTEVATHTTPPPEILYRLMAQWRDAGASHIVMEASAQALAQGRTAACSFAVAALTNISRDHGEYFPSMIAYRHAKRLLFTGLRPSSRAVLPIDDPEAAFFGRATTAPVVGYGDGGTIAAVTHGPPTLDGQSMVLSLQGRLHHVFIPLPGLYNIRNALCAAATAVALGVPDDAIVRGLEDVEPVVGRTVIYQTPEGIRAVVDYAHNPAGLLSVLRLLRATTPGRLVVVMGARGQRDKGKRPLMGAVIAALSDELVLTSDRPLTEDPAVAAQGMLTSALACGVPGRFVRDRAQAIAVATAHLGPGDCILVSGKGNELWLGDSTSAVRNDLDALATCLPGLCPRPRHRRPSHVGDRQIWDISQSRATPVSFGMEY